MANGSSSPWLGDLRTCLLMDEGWAFRLTVDRLQLAGRAGWRLPLAFADALGLEEDEHRFFEPGDSRLGEEVALSRVDRKCLGGPIDMPLGALGAREGDLAFFAVRGDRYNLVLRRRNELGQDDPLGRLLWSCGLDPRDAKLRERPWPQIARRLGRSGDTRSDVRSALVQRRDEAMVQLLDELERGGAHAAAGQAWPSHWALIMPITHDESSFGMIGADGSQRVAVGVADTSGQPPRGLVVSDGGLLWLHHEVAVENEDLWTILREDPAGMHAAAHNAKWVRWLRAEHWARRSALLGVGWEIAASDDRWWVGSMEHSELVSALEQVAVDTEKVPRAPARGPRSRYPVSATPFTRAARNARRSSLKALRAHELEGFAAKYGDSERLGPTLLDVLD